MVGMGHFYVLISWMLSWGIYTKRPVVVPAAQLLARMLIFVTAEADDFSLPRRLACSRLFSWSGTSLTHTILLNLVRPQLCKPHRGPLNVTADCRDCRDWQNAHCDGNTRNVNAPHPGSLCYWRFLSAWSSFIDREAPKGSL